MITILIILGVLVFFWYLNYTSKNDYFLNPKKGDYKLIREIYANFGWSIETFHQAWVYFHEHPNEYNGSSVVNDRFMIKGLEPMSVEHDYEWIIAKSLKDLHISNINYCKKLRDTNSNWFYVYAFIFCGLTIVSVFKSIKYIK